MTNASYGDNDHVAATDRSTEDLGLFTLWQNLAAKNEKFGHPEKFLGQIDKTKWMSYLLSVENYPEFFDRIERKSGSRRGTGGAMTFMDSGWEISLVVYDRQYFPGQEGKNRDVLWGDGLFGERDGNYIKKPMSECTGNEIIEELLYHFDMLDIKEDVLKHAHISTCMMPYITSQFMSRTENDRPRIIPEGCTNLAFIGQYVEVPRDVVFTIETSVRTPLEAVYGLLHLDKEIIEVNPGRYDIRYIVERIKKFADIEGNVTKDDLPNVDPIKLVEGKEEIERLLLERINNIPSYYTMYPGRDKTVAKKKAVLQPKYPIYKK